MKGVLLMKREDFLAEAMKRLGKDGSMLFNKYKVRTHWCMMQTYYFMHDVVGIKEFPYTFSCSGFTATAFARKRMNHDYSTAEVGDIVLFETNGNRADGADHVGVVIANTGHSIKLLEGNTRGHSVLYYDTSTTNIFEYSYNPGCFDCIIDMSEFFTDGDESNPATDTVSEPVSNVMSEKTEKVVCKVELEQLSFGCKSPSVETMQNLLADVGYGLEVDGIFGNETKEALADFQKKNKLKVDSICGSKTWKALIEAV